MRGFLTILAVAMLATAAGTAGSSMTTGAYAYGADSRQRLDLYAPNGKRPVPLILFIHGGGWSAGSKAMGEGGQPAWAIGNGYAWAALNYRLVPSATVEEQAMDVARAIAWLRSHAARLKLDMGRVVLIGHSSGAQLAGLIATDPQWLAGAGVPFSTIKAVVSLDGAGIDVPGIMAAGAAGSPFFANAFGPDVGRQTRLSPLAHLGPPDAPRWLFIHDQAHNPAAGFFAERFAEIGRKRGLVVSVVPAADTTHMKMLNQLGAPGVSVTQAVEEVLKEAFAERAVQ